jgi:pimeloyl-ACP methyl ester carboxylesterase
MGAVTVALFAGLYPDVPGRIVLEDPPPFERLASPDDQSLAARKVWSDIAAANKNKSLQELVEISRRENPSWPEAERLPWAQSKQQISLTIFDEGRVDPGTDKQIVSRIICPVLILTADLDKHAIFPPAEAEKLAASLPFARHVNIPGAGHNIRREQPEAYLKAVRGFLKESL